MVEEKAQLMISMLEESRPMCFLESVNRVWRLSEGTRGVDHVKNGILMRHHVIRDTREKIGCLIDGQGSEPLSAIHNKDAALYLNAFYQHICGSLDNLAWIIKHTLDILPGATESGSGRMDVSLFGKKFLRILKQDYSELHSVIARYMDWNQELKEYRDPGAHRIPLCLVTSFLNEDEAEKYKEFHNEFSEKVGAFAENVREHGFDQAAKEVGAALELLYAAEGLGTFAPRVVTDTGDKKVLSPPGQLDLDYHTYMDLVIDVLRVLIAELDGG
jgi:hypothetical protein